MPMPNLFVAGAPKCGTTSMHEYLSQHPDIFMCDSAHKEPQFFLYEGDPPRWPGPGDHWMRDAVITDRARYLALFDGAGDARYRGESSPYYLWSPTAQERILRECPDARFIVMLRDPVERAASLWRHLWAQGRETAKTVAEGMQRDAERRALGWEPFWQYRELGLYGEQIERMLKLVPREQLKVVYHDDLVRDARGELAGIFDWLGVRDDVEIDTSRRFMETPRIEPTARNRVLQAAVSRKSAVKRVIPTRIRRRVGSWLLDRLVQRGAASGTTVKTAVPTELRAAFRADLDRLQAQLGDVPQSWWG